MSGQTANQQSKTDEALKHWFGGFFDGEGSIFVGYGRNQYSPRISVCNTDVGTLFIVEAALKAFDLPYFIQWRKGTNPRHAARWALTIGGWKRCFRGACALLEYLHTKRPQCEDMLELCKLRLEQGGPYGYHPKPHTPRQLALIGNLRGKRGRFKPSD